MAQWGSFLPALASLQLPHEATDWPTLSKSFFIQPVDPQSFHWPSLEWPFASVPINSPVSWPTIWQPLPSQWGASPGRCDITPALQEPRVPRMAYSGTAKPSRFPGKAWQRGEPEKAPLETAVATATPKLSRVLGSQHMRTTIDVSANPPAPVTRHYLLPGMINPRM